MNHCIITNNCYGLDYYKKQNIPYNTPFVGLFLYGECYIKLLENFEHYMKQDLKCCFCSKYGKTNYPVGVLGNDVEIHFLHYTTFQDAYYKWNRRKIRMKLFHECIVKMCDRDGFDQQYGKRFLNLPIEKKILFVTPKNNVYNNKQVVVINEENCPTGVGLEFNYPLHNYFH